VLIPHHFFTSEEGMSMLRNKLILGSLMFVGLLAGVPNKAHAGGWTVYSYNFWFFRLSSGQGIVY
jgi:hypothetical protein